MNLRETLRYIDTRVENYSLPLYTEIISLCVKDEREQNRAQKLLQTSLRVANLYDLYFEGSGSHLLTWAQSFEGRLLSNRLVDRKARKDLLDIKDHLLGFFDVENDIWLKTKKGIVVPAEEIFSFMERRSSDALAHGRLLEIFTNNPDVTKGVYVYMQLLDYCTEFVEYEDDFSHELPNMVYMYLASRLASGPLPPSTEIPSDKKGALLLSRQTGLLGKVDEIAQGLSRQSDELDLRGFELLRKKISMQKAILLEAVHAG